MKVEKRLAVTWKNKEDVAGKIEGKSGKLLVMPFKK
jgi:hypothetical protein